MEMSKEGLKKFINEHFDDKNNQCARSLGLAPSTVSRIVNGTNKAGIKVITNVIKYCNEKDIKYDEYINLS